MSIAVAKDRKLARKKHQKLKKIKNNYGHTVDVFSVDGKRYTYENRAIPKTRHGREVGPIADSICAHCANGTSEGMLYRHGCHKAGLTAAEFICADDRIAEAALAEKRLKEQLTPDWQDDGLLIVEQVERLGVYDQQGIEDMRRRERRMGLEEYDELRE